MAVDGLDETRAQWETRAPLPVYLRHPRSQLGIRSEREEPPTKQGVPIGNAFPFPIKLGLAAWVLKRSTDGNYFCSLPYY